MYLYVHTEHVFRRKIQDTFGRWKDDGDGTTLLVEGAKHVGKTTAIRELGKGYDSFVELDLENRIEHRDIFSGHPDGGIVLDRIDRTFGRRVIVPGRTLILLDEIQCCPAAMSFVTRTSGIEDVDIVASCSVPPMTAPLRQNGIVRSVRMDSMDFEEFLWASGVPDSTIVRVGTSISDMGALEREDEDLMNRRFSEYLGVGGMPSAVKTFMETGSFGSVREVTSRIAMDHRAILARHTPHDNIRIQECYLSIPRQLAKRENRFLYGDIECILHANDRRRRSAREYRDSIDWMADSDIAVRCERMSDPDIPLSGNGVLFKLYLRDTGILASMYGPEDGIGPIAENCVADLMSKAGMPLFHYKNKSTNIDFITESNWGIVGIEIGSGNDGRSKSLRSAMDRGMIQRGIRLEGSDVRADGFGIEHYPLFAVGFLDYIFRRTG